jgi:hypothetical protein
MNKEVLIRSLFRREIKVLYWKCTGEQYKQIALRFKKRDGTPYTEDWVQVQVTSAYKRLGVPEGSNVEKSDYLDQNFCDEILKFKEEELNSWPLYGWKPVEKDGQIVYEAKTKKDLPKGETKEPPQIPSNIEPDEEDEEDLNPEFPQDVTPEPPVEPPTNIEETQPEPHSTTPPTPPLERSRDFEFRPPRNQPRNRWWVAGLVVLCLGCLFLAWRITIWARANLGPEPTAVPTNTRRPVPSFTPFVSPTRQPTQTPAETSTPEHTETPENTATLEIPPTAVLLPIIEDFSKEWRPEWRVIGNPYVTESVHTRDGFAFSGVLTTGLGETATLWIGNTAWTDYTIAFAGTLAGQGTALTIGLRVEDLNNMVAISCRPFTACHWVIIDDGIREDLPGETTFWTTSVIINVEGDTYTAAGSHPGFQTMNMRLVLPPKYEGKFKSGGVMFQITSNLEIDNIEIHQFP